MWNVFPQNIKTKTPRSKINKYMKLCFGPKCNCNVCKLIRRFFVSVWVVFFLQTFTIHRTAGESGGYFFNSSVSLSSASQTLRH